MMKALGSILGEVMYWCYALVQNYGLAIILFTLLTKVVLLPFSIWLHKNGIKIVKLQAKINTVKAEYYGDAGMIAEKQSELYKQEKYNPLVNLIPIMIQLILLMGLIEVIYHPLTYILHLDSDCIQQLVASAMSLQGITEAGASIQLSVVDLVKTGELQGALAMLPENMDTALRQIEGLRMDFLGINMCGIPSELGGLYVLSPLLAEGFRVVVRPHPEYVKRFRAQANALRERWAHVDAERLSMEMDFTSNVTIFTADTVVTDWSGIAYEFSFATLKKTLYIDTPMKVSNPDFYRCKTPPFDLNIRDRIGVRLKPEEVEKAGATVRAMLAGQRENEENLRAIRDESVFHIGHSGEYAGKYLLQRLLERAKKQ